MNRRFSILTLLVLSLGIYVATAAQPALLDDADASHALVSREMLQRGDWVVMYQDGIRYLEKAPLHYWMVAVSYKLFGQGAFQTRLPLVLGVAGLVLMVYFFARRFFGETAAFYSGLIICTSVGPWLFTRVMVPEAIFALELTALFYLFLRGWQGSLDTRVAYWGASVVMALAALTLGLIGVLFPLGVVFFFILFTRSWGRWRELRIFSSTLIFLVIAVPWHWIAEERSPGFLWSYFINEHFKRALGTRYPPDYEAVPLLLWWALHLVWFFPWSFFIGYALREFPRPKTWGPKMEHVQEARLPALHLGGPDSVFLFPDLGSRMEYYSFGAWPAIAVMLGIGLTTRKKCTTDGCRACRRDSPSLVFWPRCALATWCDFARTFRPRVASRTLSISLRSILTGFRWHTSSGPDPADFRGAARSGRFRHPDLYFWFWRAWLLRRRSKNFAATLTLAFAMALFFFAANWAFRSFEPRMSSRALADAILPYLRPQDHIVHYGDLGSGSSIPFYTHRHVWIYNGRFGTNLEIGSNYPDVPPTFLDDKQFPAFWSGPERVFIFVPEEFRKDAFSRLPPDSSYLLADSAAENIFREPAAAPRPSTARVGAEAASGGVSR